MNDINQVFLVGRLTRDSETKYTASGLAICRFSLAVNRRTKKGDQWVDDANFFDITLLGKTAEGLGKYLVKGKQVAITGELRQERWEKDGQRMSKVSIMAQGVQLIGSPQGESQPVQFEESAGFDDDEIPF